MNFVFLSPHFPANFHLFCVHLHQLGVRVLGLADERYDALRPELRESLTEYYRVGDLHDYPALVRACRHFVDRHGKLDRIESHNEHWLETQAQLRQDFDVPGMTPGELPQIKRKSLMKQTYRNAGIPVARGAVARTEAEALQLAAETGYPLVAKPDVGVGAAATYKIHDERELAGFYASKPPGDFILEEFISGIITTYDGLVDARGQVAFTNSLVYSQGVMETVNEDRHIHFYTQREIPPDIEALGRKTLAAFGLRESFFHFEYFRQPDGRIVALEVNMRPPGSPVLDMFDFSADVDLYREWAKIVVHGTTDLSYERKFFVCYAGRKLKNSYAHTHEQVLERCAGRIVLHNAVPPIFSRAMGDYTYILRTPDFQEMQDMVQFVQHIG